MTEHKSRVLMRLVSIGCFFFMLDQLAPALRSASAVSYAGCRGGLAVDEWS
jgi:hypothetical protein